MFLVPLVPKEWGGGGGVCRIPLFFGGSFHSEGLRTKVQSFVAVSCVSLRLQDTIMLGLRLREGVNLNRALKDVRPLLRDRLLSTMGNAVKPYASQGLVRLKGGCLHLFDPEGFVVSNDVIASLFAALEEEFMVTSA